MGANEIACDAPASITGDAICTEPYNGTKGIAHDVPVFNTAYRSIIAQKCSLYTDNV
jgi:hypothetical protein